MPQTVRYAVVVGLRSGPTFTTVSLYTTVPDTVMPETIEQELYGRMMAEWATSASRGTPFEMERIVDVNGNPSGMLGVAPDDIAWMCTRVLDIEAGQPSPPPLGDDGGDDLDAGRATS